MRVLITGTSGQVGGSLASILAGDEFKLDTPQRDALDLSDKASILSYLDAHPADIIVNCAAYTAVDQAEDEPDLADSINAQGPKVLADWCAEHRAALLHISTDYVFEGKKDGAYAPHDPIAPLGVYGRSKAEGELNVLSAGCPALIIRTSWVYAEEGKNFVRTMLRIGQSSPQLKVVFDQKGSPTHARDLASAIAVVLRFWQARGFENTGIYHYSGARQISWYEFAERIFDFAEPVLGYRPTILPVTSDEYKTRSPRPANTFLDSSLIHETFGIPLADWEKSLENAVKKILREGVVEK